MAEKKILILGASLYQLEAVRAALAMGLTVFTLDNRPENPGHILAHRSFSVDTTDCQAVIEIARRERIDGILAPATDVALPTAAFVAEQLGLSGVSFAAAEILCRKSAFRRFQKKVGLPVPAVVSADLVDSALFTGSPWIIKPVRSSGSKGIFIVRNFAEYCQRLPQSRVFSLDNQVLLEEFISGFQGTVEGVLAGGRIAWSVFLDRQTAAPPYVATRGHHLPTRLTQPLQAEVLSQLEKIFRTLKVEEGPFDADFVICGRTQSCYILETAPRLGGNSISRLVRLACGFDLVDYALKNSLGLDCSLPEAALPKPAAVALLGVEESGFLVYDEVFARKLESRPQIARLSLEAASGSRVSAFIDGTCRLGELLVQAPNRERLDRLVDESLAGLNFRGVPR